ncbi:MAG: metallophosphoesterase [Caulobacter sp.]
MSKSFNWLHLSDLHAGLAEQSWLWPRLKDEFLRDLGKVHDLAGPWDAVIFTGDLTQRASSEQFDHLTTILTEIWGRLRELGSFPIFVCIPGNHDLVRPKSADARALGLKRWWDEEVVRNAFWTEPEGEFRGCVTSAFENFLTWRQQLASAGIPVPDYEQGHLPGDFSATIEFDGGRAGLVGLNSTWLQLDGSDCEKRLAIDPRQLHGVTNGDPAAWLKKHDLSLILTHHPAGWLHPRALETWEAEINPPGWFDLHLYGHMHVPDAASLTKGGALARRSLQAASIFGLENISEGKLERLHGYAAIRIQASPTRELQVWPRRLEKQTSGARALVPDFSLSIDEETRSFKFALEPASVQSISAAAAQTPPILSAPQIGQSGAARSATLAKARYFIPKTAASVNVRRIEQRSLIEALEEKEHAAWLTGEWGAGSDGFVWAVQENSGTTLFPIYRIDCSEYKVREDFLEEIKDRLDLTLEQFCQAVSESGSSYLIFDDAPTTGIEPPPGTRHFESDLEDMVGIIVQFCPDLRILLRGRQPPSGANLPIISLKMLDEADTRAYIADHPNGGDEFTSADAVSTIFRHSDGVPSRIDSALRDLEIVTLDQLAASNLDLNTAGATSPTAPKAIASAVAELTSSNDPNRNRSYELLKALAAFPQGESMDRLKRFNGAYPLFPAHARELIENALVTSASIAQTQGLSSSTAARVLIVPRPVRDYVRSILSKPELSDISKRAADLYFGEKWMLGQIRPGALTRFKSTGASSAELVNASTIIIRLLNDAIEAEDGRGIKAAIDLAASYVGTLNSGNHFRYVLSICRDVINLTPEEYAGELPYILLTYGKSLRMMGKHDDALRIFNDILESGELIGHLDSLYLNLSLSHQSLKNSEKAKDFAKLTIRQDKHSNLALQAQAVLLQEMGGSPDRDTDLLRLEKQCRRKGAHVVANNLALDRARRDDSEKEDVEAAVDAVLSSALKDKDFYNGARAIVRRVRLKLKNSSLINDQDRAMLIDSYHFALGERINNLFDQTHEVLWNLFDSESDTQNLFKLFRHSSLIWRLRDDGERESIYLKRLARHAGEVLARDVRSLDREAAYYLVRAAAS